MDQKIDDLLRHLDKKTWSPEKKMVIVQCKKNVPTDRAVKGTVLGANEKLPSLAVQKQNRHSLVTKTIELNAPIPHATALHGTKTVLTGSNPSLTQEEWKECQDHHQAALS